MDVGRLYARKQQETCVMGVCDLRLNLNFVHVGTDECGYR